MLTTCLHTVDLCGHTIHLICVVGCIFLNLIFITMYSIIYSWVSFFHALTNIKRGSSPNAKRNNHSSLKQSKYTNMWPKSKQAFTTVHVSYLKARVVWRSRVWLKQGIFAFKAVQLSLIVKDIFAIKNHNWKKN